MAAGPYPRLRPTERGSGPIRFRRTVCATGRGVMRVELGELGFAEGGALLIKRALRLAAPGQQISVSGSAPDLELHLRSWCRMEGHTLQWRGDSQALITVAATVAARWSGAERAGSPDPSAPLDRPMFPHSWGIKPSGSRSSMSSFCEKST